MSMRDKGTQWVEKTCVFGFKSFEIEFEMREFYTLKNSKHDKLQMHCGWELLAFFNSKRGKGTSKTQ